MRNIVPSQPIDPMEKALRAFREWYRLAAVRRCDSRAFGDEKAAPETMGPNLYFSLAAIHPVLAELLADAMPEKVVRFEIIQLYRHLRFTTSLEHYFVLPTLQDLAFGKLEYAFPKDLSFEALKIATDEAFHGQRSEELIRSIEATTGVPCSLDFFEDEYMRSVLDDNSLLRKFFFCFVSETIISSIISRNSKSVRHPEVRKFFNEHFSDEVVHSTFFCVAFSHLWPLIPAAKKEELAPLFEGDICKFTRPNWDEVVSDLRSAGLDDAATILENRLKHDEALRAFVGYDRARTTTSALFQMDEERIVVSRPFFLGKS
jgi:hypothetical protein